MIGSYEEVAELLDRAESVAIVTHIRPDADAIGSATALAMALEQRAKRVSAHIGQTREIAASLLSIPWSERIELGAELPEDAELIVAVDCGSLDRTGLLAPAIERRAGQLLVIDHHATNEGFGAHNLIDRVESTTVMVRRLCELLSVQLDGNLAHSLYAGLMTDTGSFRWGTPRMHELASELMAYGVDTRQIAVDLLDSLAVDDVRMIGHVLGSLQLHEAGSHRLAVLVARTADTAQASQSAVETLVDFVRDLEGTDLGVVFKEQEESTWAVSLRSASMDVSRIATALGGGGHVPAAGYTVTGAFDTALASLLRTVKEGE